MLVHVCLGTERRCRCVRRRRSGDPQKARPRVDLIGVLKITANRQTARQPTDRDAHGQQQAAQIGGCRLPSRFGSVAKITSVTMPSGRAAGAAHESSRSARADPVDRADRTAEDVIATAELAGTFHRDHVLRLLDHADRGLVATRIAADPALGVLGRR